MGMWNAGLALPSRLCWARSAFPPMLGSLCLLPFTCLPPSPARQPQLQPPAALPPPVPPRTSRSSGPSGDPGRGSGQGRRTTVCPCLPPPAMRKEGSRMRRHFGRCLVAAAPGRIPAETQDWGVGPSYARARFLRKEGDEMR